MNDHEIQQATIERVHYFIDMGNRLYAKSFSYPIVRFNKRGTTAGTANINSWEINFNMELLRENFEAFMNDTVPHEVAHLVDQKVFNPNLYRIGKRRVSHGPTWKGVMRSFGYEPSRCHNYDTTNTKISIRKTIQFVYHCSSCGETIKVGKTRHNRMQTGKQVYVHSCNRSTKGQIVYTGKTTK